MFDSFKNNVILTKIRAMYGKRLTEEDYSELLRKRSVAEIAAYLKNQTAYSQTLSSINENSIHRGFLELMLGRYQFDMFERLNNYDPSQSGFLNHLMLKSEVNEILRCIMYIQSEDPEGFIADIPAFINKHASFDIMSLASCRSFDDLLNVLGKTDYRRILTPLLKAGSTVDMILCETELYNYIYSKTVNNIKSVYRGKTRRDLLELITTEIELKNIGTLFRAKVYFEMPADESLKLTYPFWIHLHSDDIEKLSETKNEDTFLHLLFASPYSKKLSPDEFINIDNYLDKIKFVYNRRVIRFSSNAPVALYAFAALCAIENYNITNIIEGVRYSIAADDIKKLLIL